MPWLIESKLRAVREADRREESPALVGDIPRHFDSLAPQLVKGGPDVVTHEVKLVAALPVGWMNREFSWRQGENEPPSPRIGRRHAEDVAEEPANLLRLGREHDCVHPGDHAVILAALPVS
jgi:hypothetical protein